MSEEKGHISKEKWEEMGKDPEQYRTKEEWDDKGDKILPIVKKNLEDIKKEFGTVKQELAESRQAFTDFQEFQTTARQADAKTAYQKAMQDITTEQRKAAGDMEMDVYDALESKKGEIYQQYISATKVPEKKVKEEPSGPNVSEEETARGKAFVESNGWFNTDPVMKAYAQAQSFSLMDTDGNINYDQLEKDVKSRFPEKFTNPRRDDANFVEGGSTKVRPRGKKTFEDLPESAKKAYAGFSKQMPKFTKEAYLADYQWD